MARCSNGELESPVFDPAYLQSIFRDTIYCLSAIIIFGTVLIPRKNEHTNYENAVLKDLHSNQPLTTHTVP